MRVRLLSIAAAALALHPLLARAGGLQLPTRGVRPSARGGAFVAGADDLGALWFNPAGLHLMPRGERGWGVLVDVAYVEQQASYERIDSGHNPREEVESQAGGKPIPTLAAGYEWNDRWTLAFGVVAPYAALGRYPEEGPQRYSVVDFSDSLLATLELAVSYQWTDRVRFGVGLQNGVVSLDSRIVFSGCPAELVCAPEDPEFDSLGEIRQVDFFNPSGILGVQMDVSDWLRTGLAFQLPAYISGEGKIAVRLPSSGFFDGAEIEGERAAVSFWLPPILRAGVEARPLPGWRVELAGSVEFWSVHDRFKIVPKNVRIENAAGVGTYELGPLEVPREFDDTFAVHAGVEGKPLGDSPLRVLGGYVYETAASPEAYLSALTVDGAKHVLSGGAGYAFGRFTFDATFGVALVEERTVDPEVGVSPQLNPIRDPNPNPTYVNWGDYSSSWFFAGAGVSAAL